MYSVSNCLWHLKKKSNKELEHYKESIPYNIKIIVLEERSQGINHQNHFHPHPTHPRDNIQITFLNFPTTGLA